MTRIVALLVLAALAAAADPTAALAALPLVDEAAVATDAPGHAFTELPAGASRLATQGGRACRLVPPGPAGGFAVRLGAGRGLVAGQWYLLEIDFAEDAPRTFVILNRGDDTQRGVACGTSLPDSLQRYTSGNPESLDLPLSGGIRTWRSLFRLHDRFAGLRRARDGERWPLTPRDGFWVIVCQPEAALQPGSEGAAIAAIRLRAVADPAAFDLPIRRPPAELPQRHLTWREEMADGVVAARDAAGRGVDDPLAWYAAKLRTMRFLGIDVFGKDLLEFGHNQGWDSAHYGGDDWVYQTPYPERWAAIVDLCGAAGVPIMPYYEYAGSVGARSPGVEKRAQTLSGRADYTHIAWSERANCDVTDPAFRVDLANVLDATVGRFRGRARFLGAWIRPRPAAMPVSFADAARARFAEQANGGVMIGRGQLRDDAALRARYLDWWLGERRAFLLAARDVLVAGGVADPLVLFTAQAGEPVPELPGDPIVVRGDPDPWRALAGPKPVRGFAEVVASDAHLAAVLAWPTTWGGWEWDHACPPADPARYAHLPGVLMTYPFDRAYTVASPTAFAAFRGPAGLAAVRHHPLNEHVVPDELVGYVCADGELAGPACMLAHVLAMANGDPTWFATLTGMALTTGFPEHVRAFNAAYLALPALPSERIATADPAVVVRRIRTPRHGTWLAICHTGLVAKPAVRIALPAGSRAARDAVSDEPLSPVGDALELDLAPCSLRAVHLPP